MDSSLRSTTRSPPPAFPSKSNRARFFLPLSNHGMPKTPAAPSGSSVRSYRSGGFRSPQSPDSQGPLMSPPMSAKSFGTFIESEPSTPAYSPRAPSSNWDGSTLVLLSPHPGTPGRRDEPEWEMMTPMRRSFEDDKVKFRRSRGPEDMSMTVRAIAPYASLGSHPPTPTSLPPQKIVKEKPTEKNRERRDLKKTGKENIPPKDAPVENASNTNAETEENTSNTASLNKLASRVKSMWKRKSGEKKKNQRREREQLDRMEDVHWTEM